MRVNIRKTLENAIILYKDDPRPEAVALIAELEDLLSNHESLRDEKEEDRHE